MKLFATIATISFALKVGVPTVIAFVAASHTMIASLGTMGGQ